MTTKDEAETLEKLLSAINVLADSVSNGEAQTPKDTARAIGSLASAYHHIRSDG